MRTDHPRQRLQPLVASVARLQRLRHRRRRRGLQRATGDRHQTQREARLRGGRL